MLTIDKERIENEELSYYEAKYLQDRNKLPAGYPMPEYEGDDEDQEAPAPKSRVTPLDDQTQLEIGANGGIDDDDDDDEEDYLEGWNNGRRRAELSKRGLSLDGGKDEMIARLRRSDQGEEALLDEDRI